MFWLIPIGIGAGVIAIIGALNGAAEESRRRWQSQRASVERTIEEHERNIREHIDSAQKSIIFRELCDLHYSSYRVADAAYKLAGDAIASKKALSTAIENIKKEINNLFERKKLASTKNEKISIRAEITQTLELKNHLFEDKNTITREFDSYNSKVKQFNSTTYNLKIAIRDRCGDGGREWYENLERRKQARRVSS